MIGGLSGASTDVAHSHVSAERWVEREIDTGGALSTDNETDKEQSQEATWARARIQNRFRRAPGLLTNYDVVPFPETGTFCGRFRRLPAGSKESSDPLKRTAISHVPLSKEV